MLQSECHSCFLKVILFTEVGEAGQPSVFLQSFLPSTVAQVFTL